jgi:signal transduction histidine kinase
VEILTEAENTHAFLSDGKLQDAVLAFERISRIDAMADRHSKDNEVTFMLDSVGCITFLGSIPGNLSFCPSRDIVGRHYSCLIDPRDVSGLCRQFSERRNGNDFDGFYRARLAEGSCCGSRRGKGGMAEIRSRGLYANRPDNEGRGRFLGVLGKLKFVCPEEEKPAFSAAGAGLPVQNSLNSTTGASPKEFDPVENERRRIARELHDGLGQILTALKMDVERACMKLTSPDSELGALLCAASGKSMRAIQEVRAVAESLMPSPLGRLGLSGAIWELCNDLARSFGTPVQFVSDRRGRDVPPELGLTVYRVAQEALSNALQHSGARHVYVSLSYSPCAVNLSVKDDGKGFDVSAVTMAGKGRYSGLAMMRDRVEVHKGAFWLESGPPGTLVGIELPFQAGT